MNKALSRYDHFIALGNSGKKEDIDRLMNALASGHDLAKFKLVDYAISLVNTKEGVERIKYYLFNGIHIQRNYAALFFKRRGNFDLLDEALAMEKIDREQALSK